jgi:alkaline phosphatase D
MKKSPVGRTKTSPKADDSVTGVNFAVYSCSQYQNGYFNAYGNSARKDNVDFVIHLGDYIYEYSKGTVGKDPRATLPPRETVTLYDYRTRIGQYRTDLDLLLSHQKFAWISTWDDHGEVDVTASSTMLILARICKQWIPRWVQQYE